MSTACAQRLRNAAVHRPDGELVTASLLTTSSCAACQRNDLPEGKLHSGAGGGGQRWCVGTEETASEGAKPHRGDGHLNHTLQDGTAGGQGGFYLNAYFRGTWCPEITPTWSDYASFQGERCQGDTSWFFFSLSQEKPIRANYPEFLAPCTGGAQLVLADPSPWGQRWWGAGGGHGGQCPVCAVQPALPPVGDGARGP